jgi:GDP-mannose 6-dehydrogenase
MRISIFGLGYVGAVTGACMAKEGHQVIGVDPDPHKRDLISAGKSPIVEEGLDELMAEGVSSGRLRVSDDAIEGVAESDISLICVGTPSNPNGSLRLDYVERVSEQIGEAIKRKGAYHSVCVRSTVLPGTTSGIVIPALQKAGIAPGSDYGVSMNPEFLREGVSIFDFYNPPYTVIGTDSSEEFERVSGMYTGVPGEFIHCKLSTAEAIKYGCNIFHALKITFANEMGTLCKALGVDSTEALDIICKDTKLNISSKYMKPGFAFGGSCLPKDVRGYTYKARSLDMPLPMFEGSLASNRAQIERAAARISAMGSKKVAMLGVSFKEGTDDLRESPLVSLAEILIGKGFDLKIFDPNVEYASLYGSNKEFIDKELPHLKRILVSAEEALAQSDTVVFGHNAPVYKEIVAKIESRHKVFDLVRIADPAAFAGAYDGLYW